jgi:hypothetical protein
MPVNNALMCRFNTALEERTGYTALRGGVLATWLIIRSLLRRRYPDAAIIWVSVQYHKINFVTDIDIIMESNKYVKDDQQHVQKGLIII